MICVFKNDLDTKPIGMHVNGHGRKQGSHVFSLYNIFFTVNKCGKMPIFSASFWQNAVDSCILIVRRNGCEIMRVLLQRVKYAKVIVDGSVHGSIAQGFLVLVGITQSDTKDIVEKMAKKTAELRVFEDQAGKMNLRLSDVQGKILSISQFTLYADCKKGRRPGFEKAAKGDYAKPLYEYFNKTLRSYDIDVETGVFGADMKVELCNDGPVTILLDNAEW